MYIYIYCDTIYQKDLGLSPMGDSSKLQLVVYILYTQYIYIYI